MSPIGLNAPVASKLATTGRLAVVHFSWGAHYLKVETLQPEEVEGEHKHNKSIQHI